LSLSVLGEKILKKQPAKRLIKKEWVLKKGVLDKKRSLRDSFKIKLIKRNVLASFSACDWNSVKV